MGRANSGCASHYERGGAGDAVAAEHRALHARRLRHCEHVRLEVLDRA